MLAGLLFSFGHAQTPNITTVTVTDPQLVVALLRGDVQLVGSAFPNKIFQQGLLTLLRGKRITVQVLTTEEAAPSLASLKGSGAKVFVMPQGTKMTGNMLLIGNDTAVVSQGINRWYVMQGPNAAATFKTNLSVYSRYAKLY